MVGILRPTHFTAEAVFLMIFPNRNSFFVFVSFFCSPCLFVAPTLLSHSHGSSRASNRANEQACSFLSHSLSSSFFLVGRWLLVRFNHRESWSWLSSTRYTHIINSSTTIPSNSVVSRRVDYSLFHRAVTIVDVCVNTTYTPCLFGCCYFIRHFYILNWYFNSWKWHLN